jgi:hypothetical protein
MITAIAMIIAGSMGIGALIAAAVLIRREAKDPIDEYLKTRNPDYPEKFTRRSL